MPSQLAGRLAAARRRRFVGRQAELRCFTEALGAPGGPVSVIAVHGPAGVGKTSLTRRFTETGLERGHAVLALDGRDLPATASALEMALAPLKAPLQAPLQAPLKAPPNAREEAARLRPVVVLDTYELLADLDDWLRDTLLPGLPDDVLVVLSGRHPPGPGWRLDPGWADLVRVLPLRNLPPEESLRYLEVVGAPVARRQECVDFTHGYPLALALVGEVLSEDAEAAVADSPDLVRDLLGRLLDDIPGGGRYRAALEACAVVRVLNQPLLAALLAPGEEGDGAGELFEWLRGLPVVDSGPGGVFPHDLTREVLDADLRWRDPDRHEDLHARARAYYLDRLPGAPPEARQRLLLDLMYLHSGLRAFLTGGVPAEGAQDLGALRPGDERAVTAMVGAHEGPESAALAGHWLRRAPGAWLVVRDAAGEPCGAMAMLPLEDLGPADAERDPAVAAALAELTRRPPLREGERATHLRFWLSRDDHQGVSPVQNLIAARWAVHYLTTPGLAMTFTPFAEPERWAGFCAYADQFPMPAAGFRVGDRTYGVFGHDWRAVPPEAWVRLMTERESLGAAQTPTAPEDVALLVLSHEEFAESVRAALRDLQRPDRLARNPLLRSRLVAARADGESTAARVAGLTAVLEEATGVLQRSPRDSRGYRAIHRTYLRPAGTQEKAAEVLGLPSSTYRRHLAAGVARVIDLLWDGETRA